MHHVGCMAALNLILNCIEFRTNHEPYMVHSMVQGTIRIPNSPLPPLFEDKGGKVMVPN